DHLGGTEDTRRHLAPVPAERERIGTDEEVVGGGEPSGGEREPGSREALSRRDAPRLAKPALDLVGECAPLLGSEAGVHPDACPAEGIEAAIVTPVDTRCTSGE